MKKIIAASSVACFFFLVANTVTAHDLTEVGANTTITITDGGSSGQLEFNASPGVQIAYATTDATYILMGLNTSAAVDDQNEYGIHSGYSGYYQNNTTTADTFSVTTVGYSDATTDLADPFSSWTAMGGAGGAS